MIHTSASLQSHSVLGGSTICGILFFYGQEKDFVFISAVKKILKNEGGRVSDLKKKIKILRK